MTCFVKTSLREAPLTSNHSGYGSNTTNQIEDQKLTETVDDSVQCNRDSVVKSVKITQS